MSLSPANKRLIEAASKILKGGVELEEGKSSTGYELYHKDFSSAMAHAYAHAKKKYGIEVDPEEVDNKVALGPKKPNKGKTNTYRLLGKDGKKAFHVQVYGMDSGKYELNMYKESKLKEGLRHIKTSNFKAALKSFETVIKMFTPGSKFNTEVNMAMHDEWNREFKEIYKHLIKAAETWEMIQAEVRMVESVDDMEKEYDHEMTISEEAMNELHEKGETYITETNGDETMVIKVKYEGKS